MTIDWNAFTPMSALAGGALIGSAAALLILLNGRVAGISGVLGSLVGSTWPRSRRPGATERAWRVAFTIGLVAAPLAWTLFGKLAAPRIDAGIGALVVAGVLVGIGTRYGAGCTSGHGVCGLSRLSLRSLGATLAFMGTGFTTVFLIRHVVGA